MSAKVAVCKSLGLFICLATIYKGIYLVSEMHFFAFCRAYSLFGVHANRRLLNISMGEQMSLSSFPLAIFSCYLEFLRICELLEKFA